MLEKKNTSQHVWVLLEVKFQIERFIVLQCSLSHKLLVSLPYPNLQFFSPSHRPS